MANTKITSRVIAADAVLTANITDANVTTAKIADDAVTSAKVADDAINSEHLAADSIDAEHYAAGSVDATAIASNAVTTAKINDDAVTTAKIADAQITTALMADDSITSAKLDTNIAIAGTLDSTGKITADAGIDIDNFNIDGTTIALSSGDMTLDVAGNIQLDADDAGEVRFIDGGTTYATIKKDGNNAVIQSIVADGDLVFQGIDGSSFITPMYIDMSAGGRIGIGTTSPNQKLEVNGNILLSNNQEIRFKDSGGNERTAFSLNSSNDLNIGTSANGNLKFINGSSYTERMRIDSSGNVGIGTSSPAHKLDIYDGTLQINAPSGTGNAWTYYRNTDRVYLVGCRGSGGDVLAFYDLSADTQRMQIETSGNIGAGGSSTNIYNASDERLKENILPLSNSLDTIKKLNPVKFNWIDNFAELEKDKTLYGFVAQEVQDVFPDAVQPFCDGKPVTVDDKVIENPLTVREKFLVPMLVKAIQEQQVIIDDLKSRIKTLEDA